MLFISQSALKEQAKTLFLLQWLVFLARLQTFAAPSKSLSPRHLRPCVLQSLLFLGSLGSTGSRTLFANLLLCFFLAGTLRSLALTLILWTSSGYHRLLVIAIGVANAAALVDDAGYGLSFRPL